LRPGVVTLAIFSFLTCIATPFTVVGSIQGGGEVSISSLVSASMTVIIYIPVTIAHMVSCCRGYATRADRMLSYNAQYYRCIAEPIFMVISAVVFIVGDEGRNNEGSAFVLIAAVPSIILTVTF
jgi:hypothetical protein